MSWKDIKLILHIILTLSSIVVTTTANKEKKKSVLELYEAGVNSYLEERWQDCIDYMEKSMKEYKEVKNRLILCRMLCNRQSLSSEASFKHNVDELHFFERNLKNTLCLMKCKKRQKTIDYDTLTEVEKQRFEDLKPYDYLHLCYYQKNALQEAANAAFTFLSQNPHSHDMKRNFKYYSGLPEVKLTEITNKESPVYVSYYLHGIDAYEKKEYNLTIYNMEESLHDFIESLEKCRAQCEGPFDQGWFPDFSPSIANHFAFVLKCKKRCYNSLTTINGNKIEDFLPSHYHYLQFAYYKVNNLKKACEAVTSYLLFKPFDETMLANADHYKTLPKVNSKSFVARADAVSYMKRFRYEEKLLKFINSEFIFETLTSEDDKDEDNIDEDEESEEEKILVKNYKHRNLRLRFRELGFLGERFVGDDFATQNECEDLTGLVQFAGEKGDGYAGNLSPHTDLETFEGMTLSRIALLAYLGVIDVKTLELVLELSENVRSYVKRSFKIKKPLYFSYVHLVKRTAMHMDKDTDHMSHKIHADNCILQPSGECIYREPAFTWNTHSAILYLNEDFEGGQFIFAATSRMRKIQSVIKPKCGRLVGFTSGKENPHGVKGLKRGSRYALAFWFTTDKEYKSQDKMLADQTLIKIYTAGNLTSTPEP